MNLIPTNQKVINEKLTISFQDEIPERIPDDIKIVMNSHLTESNKLFRGAISDMLHAHQEKKHRFIESVTETYDLLIDHLKVCHEKKQNFKCTIPGRGHYASFNKPTTKNWIESNADKYKVIDWFVRELKRKGWFPYVEASEFKYVWGAYYGGRDLVITCNFE